MLGKAILLLMFRYDYETNNRLLDHAAKITAAQWDAPQEVGQRSLHATFFHILAVQEEWLHLCQHGVSIWNTRPRDAYPDVASLRVFSDQLYQTYLPYLESLTETALTALVKDALMPDGDTQSVTLWKLLIHAFYHSAQHRSEIASMLTRYGHSPGDIDFYGYMF
jgi:uncharacterized damage-inducible protein DinB